MLADSPLPSASEVDDVFSGLLGRSVEVDGGDSVAASKKSLIVVFNIGEQADVCVMLWSLQLACSCGAALTMIPSDTADESAKGRDVPANLMENIREICNICSRLLTKSSSRAVLADVQIGIGDLAENVKALLDNPGARVDFEVEIDGYTGGSLSFLV